MELTEDLISSIMLKVNGSMTAEFDGERIDFSPPWRRMTMMDAIKEYTGLEF